LKVINDEATADKSMRFTKRFLLLKKSI